VFYGLDWIATVPPTLRLTVQTMGPTDGPIVFGSDTRYSEGYITFADGL